MNIRMATYDGYDPSLKKEEKPMKKLSAMTMSEVSKELAETYAYAEICVKNDPSQLQILQATYGVLMEFMVTFMAGSADFLSLHEMSLSEVQKVFENMALKDLMEKEEVGNA